MYLGYRGFPKLNRGEGTVAFAQQHGAVGADDIFFAGMAEVSGDEVGDGRGSIAGIAGQGGGCEVLRSGEGAIPFSQQDGDLLGADVPGSARGVRDSDDVEFAISIDVIDNRRDGGGSGGWVRDTRLERAVGVAEQDIDGATGGENTVGNDQVAIAVPVEVCRS